MNVDHGLLDEIRGAPLHHGVDRLSLGALPSARKSSIDVRNRTAAAEQSAHLSLGAGAVWLARLSTSWLEASTGRSLPSILFVTTIIADAPEFQDLETVSAVMTWTVLLSIVAHGLSAWPASNRYSAFCEANPDKMEESPAMQPLPDEILAGRSGSVMGRHSPTHHEDRGHDT